MPVFTDHLQRPIEKPAEEPVVWRPGAYGILENEKGEWFMVEPTWAKQWDLPGGGINIDESIKEGLVREFYEETCYRVEVMNEPLYVGESHFYHKKLGFCHCVYVIYHVRLVDQHRDEAVVNTFDDGNEIKLGTWVDPMSLKQTDVHPIYWPYIQQFQTKS